jgi:hypothetical protein
VEFEEKTELKWLNETIKKIERGLLQAENVDLPESRRTVLRIEEIVASDKKKLDELKAKRIRLLAVIEEKKEGV